ncbi:MAG: hypothetical protein WA359_09035 [Acidimicrobiales bacterium]
MSVIYPELVAGRADDEWRAWTIREGSTARGEASCNLHERILEVPLSRDEQARVVRAHELMHARVSPRVDYLMRALDEVAPRALECAEELRVNVLVGRLGFDLAQLSDGSEKLGARRLGESGQWAEALCFYMAVLGTGAERAFLSGIRQGDATWLPALRAVRKRALAIFARDTRILGATQLDETGLPSGYATSTLVLARLLTQTACAKLPRGADELRAFRRSLEAGGRRPPTGVFAPLVLDEAMTGARVSPRGAERRWRAETTGTVLRYPSRLVNDEHRRAFGARRARHGGVVVIDQSGSMDVTQDDLKSLLRTAPAALVIGYSHRPGDRGTTPNAWVLCDQRVVARSSPSGNVGNGVDGPVLAWAASRRRSGEPFVWVTDGQVTDSHDYPDAALSRECALMVRGHQIRLVRDLSGVAQALRADRPTARSQWDSFGRVGQALGELSPI